MKKNLATKRAKREEGSEDGEERALESEKGTLIDSKLQPFIQIHLTLKLLSYSCPHVLSLEGDWLESDGQLNLAHQVFNKICG